MPSHGLLRLPRLLRRIGERYGEPDEHGQARMAQPVLPVRRRRAGPGAGGRAPRAGGRRTGGRTPWRRGLLDHEQQPPRHARLLRRPDRRARSGLPGHDHERGTGPSRGVAPRRSSGRTRWPSASPRSRIRWCWTWRRRRSRWGRSTTTRSAAYRSSPGWALDAAGQPDGRSGGGQVRIDRAVRGTEGLRARAGTGRDGHLPDRRRLRHGRRRDAGRRPPEQQGRPVHPDERRRATPPPSTSTRSAAAGPPTRPRRSRSPATAPGPGTRSRLPKASTSPTTCGAS